MRVEQPPQAPATGKLSIGDWLVQAEASAVLPRNIIAGEPFVEDPLPHQMPEQHQPTHLGIQPLQITKIIALGAC